MTATTKVSVFLMDEPVPAQAKEACLSPGAVKADAIFVTQASNPIQSLFYRVSSFDPLSQGRTQIKPLLAFANKPPYPSISDGPRLDIGRRFNLAPSTCRYIYPPNTN